MHEIGVRAVQRNVSRRLCQLRQLRLAHALDCRQRSQRATGRCRRGEDKDDRPQASSQRTPPAGQAAAGNTPGAHETRALERVPAGVLAQPPRQAGGQSPAALTCRGQRKGRHALQHSQAEAEVAGAVLHEREPRLEDLQHVLHGREGGKGVGQVAHDAGGAHGSAVQRTGGWECSCSWLGEQEPPSSCRPHMPPSTSSARPKRYQYLAPPCTRSPMQPCTHLRHHAAHARLGGGPQR